MLRLVARRMGRACVHMVLGVGWHMCAAAIVLSATILLLHTRSTVCRQNACILHVVGVMALDMLCCCFVLWQTSPSVMDAMLASFEDNVGGKSYHDRLPNTVKHCGIC